MWLLFSKKKKKHYTVLFTLLLTHIGNENDADIREEEFSVPLQSQL